jgi:ribosome maturation factor RimP
VSAVVERVQGLVAPVLSDLGLDLYDLDFAGGVVRVVIDRPGGVDLDAIADATRLISRELDHADPVPGRYQLEVTSPGLERRLRLPAHFRGALGQVIKVRTHAHVAGDRRVEGVLSAVDDDGITITTADGPEPGARRLAYGDIERARTVFSWEPAPKPGKGTSKAAASRAGTHGKAVS